MQLSNSIIEPIAKFIRKYKALSSIITVCLLLFILCICFKLGKKSEVYNDTKEVVSEVNAVVDLGEETKTKFPMLTFGKNDMITEPVDAVTVDLEKEKNEFLINQSGDYILSGEMKGTVVIDTIDENVHLFFDNVSISAQEGSAIKVISANQVIITLIDGTENIISDSGDYRESEEFPACIFADCNLTFNGSGKLTINGYYKDAVYSKDVLKILDGEYTVKCKRNAFHANDGIHVAGGTMFISTEKNGFKTEKKGSDGRGNLMISGGELNIIAGDYSFVTTKASLYIFDCTINQKSIINTYNIAKRKLVQEGCVNE